MTAKKSKKPTENISFVIGAVLRELREQRGLTQKEVARQLNISYSTLSHYEIGLTSPPVESLLFFAKYYGVSTDYLLNRCTSGVDYTKIINKEISKDMTIGDAVSILSKLSKKDGEHFAYILKLYVKA